MVNKCSVGGTWSQGIDYNAVRRQLIIDLSSSDLTATEKVKTSILLIQLENGGRITEAIDCFNKFIKRAQSKPVDKIEDRRFNIIVEKVGWKQYYIFDKNGNKIIDYIKNEIKHYKQEKEHKRTKIKQRLMIVPIEVSGDLSLYKSSNSNIWNYSTKRYGFRTHALRYAFITDESKKGVPAQVIASETGHQTLPHILKYTEKVAGEERLIKRFKERERI